MSFRLFRFNAVQVCVPSLVGSPNFVFVDFDVIWLKRVASITF